MSNDKFLTSKGNYGIDFNQIDRVKLDIDDNSYTTRGGVITLYIKNAKYPIIVLAYENTNQAKYVYRQLKAVVSSTGKCAVLKLDDYRKD